MKNYGNCIAQKKYTKVVAMGGTPAKGWHNYIAKDNNPRVATHKYNTIVQATKPQYFS